MAQLRFRCAPRRLFLVAALLFAANIGAHPEDEFCVPGESTLDPALCAALAELNRADNKTSRSTLSPVLDDSGNERSVMSTLGLYVSIGVAHILPGGLDHILFVLAILLASVRLRALLLQVSAFTLAHTLTLALAASGVITPPTSIVEPLIALTIAFVAVENLFSRDMTKWRPAVVFAFGLVHGLGFAGFFAELGLPREQFWSALVGFNIGVEIGQLSIIAAGTMLGLALRRVLDDKSGSRQYRRFVVLPGSLAIGVTGLWWAVQRLVS
jgi:hypothetical protein